MVDEEFKNKLRSLLMEFDLKSREYPDPAHVGFALWEYYLDKVEMPHIASEEVRNYIGELYAARREQESKGRK